MDFKTDIHSDDDFDSSNGYNDHLSNNMNFNCNGQSRNSDTNGLSKAELRKTNKPIMEKRRRARINHCLNELKSLILEAMKKDPARHTKLEKADILEMTVKHLQSIQRQQLNMAIQTDPSIIHKFKTGFVECAEEVTRYVNQLDNIDPAVRQGLANHLQKCANNLDQIGSLSNFNNGYNNMLNNPLATTTSSTLFPPIPHDLNNNNNNHANVVPTAPLQMGGMQLIPSRLPSGELALIVPNANANSVLNRTQSTSAPFTVWPPPLVQIPPQISNGSLPHNVGLTSAADFTANHQQNMSAFTKPITLIPPAVTTNPTTLKSHSLLHKKSTNCQITTKTKIYQTNNQNNNSTTNNYAHNSSTTTSPPLSPISSLSSHGDESSPLHTSSEFAHSRPATPPQHTISLFDKQSFSGVFSTPPSSSDTSLSSLNSSTHLQQQQVTSTSGRDLINSRKRSLNSTDSADSSDESSAKKFVTRNDISTDEEGACWRPW